MYFSDFLRVLTGSFRGRYIYAHLVAILVTYICVVSGFDWQYFLVVSQWMPQAILFIADILGVLVPVFLPLIVLFRAYRSSDIKATRRGLMLAYAVASAFVISMTYKIFTGRISPPHHGSLVDISNQFNFGFFQESIIGGWPSSHAMVVCALVAAYISVYKPTKIAISCSVLFALFISLAETIGFHWFSEFFAGALIGVAIGIVVGRVYAKTQQ